MKHKMSMIIGMYRIDLSSPGQNGHNFADDIFKCIFVIRISLKFVPKGLIDNKSALGQVMAWRRPADKPSPGPVMAQFTDSYMRH